MAIGKRMRFEILKRDGFRCYYCGTAPVSTPLHVDHVIPVSKGGTDDPENLISACQDCNLGKSNRPLDESALTGRPTPEDIMEQAEQIHGYLDACRYLAAAREDAIAMVAEAWRSVFGDDPFRTTCVGTLNKYGHLPWTCVLEAMEATFEKGLRGDYNRPRYYFGCLKRMSEDRRGQ